ncbi:hypothetical protein CXF92_15510 [Pseudomonas sp. Choline-3u-10]|jgi:hypothetical protein|uniref:hypothetical protein n=1 Tax=Pseudomonadaceae TaxID=135621 RepID=UPI000697E01A|nr:MULTISPECIES: hypothetical protein [Pseudomonadaceae]MAL35374.1 hypothetical protein [Pseudomonas sp.]MBU0949905.1 hypothetical protein [Gammaproteobacteria bacterium]MBK3795759.1 hypothetical protein [Stutzerimonas stutzeri]MBK3877886.1 hypothetical protein [Stutzerimonas stutzeri]PKG92558.1 hypothetical protein CXF92_15510 [Pseudomonas sp. Choline-3u-10]|tara:strand:- start:11 stop:1216 length:1206 start_codon:yes stop_codon:yes gene_type:complete
MSNTQFKRNKFGLASGAFLVALAAPLVVGSTLSLSFVSSSVAAEHSGSGKGGSDSHGSRGGQGGKGGGGEKGQGGSSKGGGKGTVDKIFRADASEEEDSDRPEWAGVKGGKSGGGGKPFGAGTKKGDLFGDMYILLRDVNGVPLEDTNGDELVVAFHYDSTGALVPVTDADGKLVAIPRNEEGDLLTSVTVGDTTLDVVPGEIELGRLNLGRSPAKVLDQALNEALSKLTADGAVIAIDSSGRLTVDGTTIDSPRENLALYDQYMASGTIPGVTLPAGFDPAALLAAAGDKTGTIGVDTLVYMNSILGINSGTTYYDFSDYQYDRTATWADATATVLVLDAGNPDDAADDVYRPTLVNLYDAVFGGTSWTDPTTEGGADDFAAAANDYLQVIEFVHDNEVR